LTAFENILTGKKLSEYHTGYRAFSREVLETLPLLENSNDFLFDNQILTQAFFFNFRIGEVSSPCQYNEESSSISPVRSIIYGVGVVFNSVSYFLHMLGIKYHKMYDGQYGKKIQIR